jgi:hypothetical protein
MNTPCEEKGLGHSDHAYWVQCVTSDCHEMALLLNGKCFMGLLESRCFFNCRAKLAIHMTLCPRLQPGHNI